MDMKEIELLRQARTRKLARLWHVGTMNPADKGRDSHEGNGLSVSLDPEVWTQIARLGAGNLYELTHKSGEFLDFHRLSQEQRQHLVAWGIARGWLVMVTRWKAQWFDDELDDTVYMLCPSEEDAQGEAQEREGQVTQVEVPALTEAAAARLGFKLEEAHALDIAATFWVEDETSLDGVWWNDRLEPQNLSAPRGVICLKRLGQWKSTFVRGPRMRGAR